MAQANPRPYIGLKDLTSVDKLATKRAELEQLQRTDAREWALNRAFYKGNQWSFFNPVSTQIETLPIGDLDKPKHKVRLVINQILPGVQYYIAQLTKTKPNIGATPDGSADRDLKAAQMAQSLFEHLWEDMNLKPKLQSALVQACLSQGYWKITWDPLAGKPMKVMMDPNGQPITDETLADIYREELQQQGMDPKQYEQTIYSGDMKVEVLPGENVLLDPNASMFEEVKYAICKHSMDPDELEARFGVQVEPNAIASEPDVPNMFGRKESRQPKNTRDVYIGYFPPSPALPEGRYVAWIESPNKILYDSPWPYPFDELPIVKFPGWERPNSPLDEPLVTHVRPLQKELNRTVSQIVQHKDLTLKPQMIAPSGSLRERLTDEPGAVFQFNPIAGLKPEWREIQGLPAYVFSHLADIQQRIDSMFNRIPASRESMPARVDAGLSIELIQEAVADQMSPVINRIEVALAKAGKIMALLAKEYYSEPRLLKIKGAGGIVQVKKFMNSDLEGGYTFHAEAESGLPRTRAGRQARIKELVEAGIMPLDQAWKHLDIADLKGLSAKFQMDEDQANREHELMLQGQPLNQIEVQNAIMAIQQGVNPETQQPFTDPQNEIPHVLENAGLKPLPFENFQAHLQVHSDYMKTPEFEALPLQVKQAMISHWQQTYEAMQSQLPTDPKLLPGVNITAKATTSASVLGEILRKHGIQVTDEQVADDPLETAIYDSVDKPDADSTGNDPMTGIEQANAVNQAQADHSQKMEQSQELHVLELQKKQADVQLAERKAKETNINPKPSQPSK